MNILTFRGILILQIYRNDTLYRFCSEVWFNFLMFEEFQFSDFYNIMEEVDTSILIQIPLLSFRKDIKYAIW